MKTYRVFVTRHYIDTCFFDVESESPAKAKLAAGKAANILRPDSRPKATDNGWIPDEPSEIAHTGYAATPFPVREYLKANNSTVWIDDSKY